MSSLVKWRTKILTFLLISLSGLSMGQDPLFTQYYSTSLYTNPAFTGINECPTITMVNRNQWPAVSGRFNSTFTSYEQYSNSLSGGIGGYIISDQQADGILKTLRVSGIYSYSFKVSTKTRVNISLESTYFQKSVDWDRMSYGDQIHPEYGFIYGTNDIIGIEQISGFDVSTGILIRTDKHFLGLSFHHLNEPKESLIFGTSRLPIKYGIQGGVRLKSNNVIKGKPVFFTPTFILNRQGEFIHSNFGIYGNFAQFTAGVWYRGILFTEYNDSFISLIGIETDNYTLGYSYDLTISQLTPSTGGSHEISLVLKLRCRDRREYRSIVCPAF